MSFNSSAPNVTPRNPFGNLQKEKTDTHHYVTHAVKSVFKAIGNTNS